MRLMLEVWRYIDIFITCPDGNPKYIRLRSIWMVSYWLHYPLVWYLKQETQICIYMYIYDTYTPGNGRKRKKMAPPQIVYWNILTSRRCKIIKGIYGNTRQQMRDIQKVPIEVIQNGPIFLLNAWWRHQMETFFALLFDVHLNKRFA